MRIWTTEMVRDGHYFLENDIDNRIAEQSQNTLRTWVIMTRRLSQWNDVIFGKIQTYTHTHLHTPDFSTPFFVSMLRLPYINL